MMKKLMGIMLGIIVLAGVGYKLGLTHNLPGQPAPNQKLQVTASFYPMAEFTRQVGGDKVEVTTLIGPGVEPHDYDPTPQDLVAVHKSKLLVYNGAGLEPWADKIKAELEKNGVVVVDSSKNISLLTKDASEQEAGNNTTYDPHVWLDP
ncbi:MAG TPA: zinc ABC transporter substrate-binding protein, partial [Candidatus Polarisedimenticolaceae bacterium]|nr:zinc ABC transporter substrate-binding protein [Candidatus Polarisedimenticolaceae bacterium]